MVERPIKKADRQNQPAPENDSTTKSAEAPKKSNPSRGKDKDKDKDKGKRNNKKEDAQPPVNLALMRGPKPSKAKPPILQTDEAEAAGEESDTEDTTAETATAEES